MANYEIFPLFFGHRKDLRCLGTGSVSHGTVWQFLMNPCSSFHWPELANCRLSLMNTLIFRCRLILVERGLFEKPLWRSGKQDEGAKPNKSAKVGWIESTKTLVYTPCGNVFIERDRSLVCQAEFVEFASIDDFLPLGCFGNIFTFLRDCL